MKVVAYCTLPAARAVAKATGTKPLTSPPFITDDVPLKALVGDVLYFRLHGTDTNVDSWFGDDGDGFKPLALRLKQVYKLKLDGAVVIIANCYGLHSPFVPAFYRAGARAVIAGPGENYAAGRRVMGSDMLARSVIAGLRRGKTPLESLNRAKRRVRLALRTPRRVRKDTLEFRIIENKQKEKHARNLK